MKMYTIVKDILDLRDILYSNRHIVDSQVLPKNIDLRNKCSPIVDQGQLGSCTANAIVSGLREYVIINNERSPLVRMSRLYLYWWERYSEGTVNEDSGASLRDGMKILQQKGVCTEATRPYDINKFTVVPTNLENNEAKKYTIPGYQRLNSISDIKHALCNDHLVAFSIVIYESFENSIGSNGIVPIPQANEQELGGHAMCIVGYNDTLLGGSFIVRNSWGTNWGANGYCYIPYTMYKYIMDAWTVKLGN